MSKRKDKRTPAQRKQDTLLLELAGAIAVLLSTVIHQVMKERHP